MQIDVRELRRGRVVVWGGRLWVVRLVNKIDVPHTEEGKVAATVNLKPFPGAATLGVHPDRGSTGRGVNTVPVRDLRIPAVVAEYQGFYDDHMRRERQIGGQPAGRRRLWDFDDVAAKRAVKVASQTVQAQA